MRSPRWPDCPCAVVAWPSPHRTRLRCHRSGPRRDRRDDLGMCSATEQSITSSKGASGVAPCGSETVIHQILAEAKTDSMIDRLRDDLRSGGSRDDQSSHGPMEGHRSPGCVLRPPGRSRGLDGDFRPRPTREAVATYTALRPRPTVKTSRVRRGSAPRSVRIHHSRPADEGGDRLASPTTSTRISRPGGKGRTSGIVRLTASVRPINSSESETPWRFDGPVGPLRSALNSSPCPT